MPWTDLYTTILKTECIGSSLSTINTNFDNFDTYIRELSDDYMSVDSVLAEIAAQGSLAKANARTNLGIGSVATLTEKVASKAWCNFNGNLSGLDTKSGTFTRSGSTLTVNIIDHGLLPGDYVYLDFSGGTTDKTVVVSATGFTPNAFRATDRNVWTNVSASHGTIGVSGVSFKTAPLRGSGYNVRKVIRVKDFSSTRESFAVHYTNDLTTNNYAVLCTGMGSGTTASTNNQSVGCAFYNTRLFVASVYSDLSGESSDHVHCVVFA